MKRFFLTLMSTLICLSYVSAEELEFKTPAKEKVVTNKWSLISGEVLFTDHYLAKQEYSGSTLGFAGEHGAFYKKSDNLSWSLDLSILLSPYFKVLNDFALKSPTGANHIGMANIFAEYGTFYNWNPVKNLYIKAGGCFELFSGINTSKPNAINNVISMDLQPQLKMAAGVKYAFNFKKFGITLSSNVSMPFMGLMLVSDHYQGSLVSSTSEILPGNLNNIVFSSFHNMSGYNLDFELAFVFKNLTWFVTSEINHRVWNAYGIQNYRKYNLSRMGISVDLVSRTRLNSKNRYF